MTSGRVLRRMIVALLLVISLPSGAVKVPPGGKSRELEAYERDRRFKGKRLTVRTSTGIALQLAVQRLSDSTKVPLVCEYSLAKRPVALALVGERQALEVMHSLAVAVSARWVRTRDGYALCRFPELAHLAGLTDEQYEGLALKSARSLMATLTQEQLNSLEHGQQLEFAALAAPQRRMALDFAAVMVAQMPDAFNADAILGRGLYLERKEELLDPTGGVVSVPRRFINIMMPSPVLGVDEAYSHPLQ